MPYICKNPWTTLYIWGNGNVTHCCYSNIGSLGNINETPLLDIWRGPKLNSVRENMAQGNYLQAGCEYFCRSYRWNKFYGSETEAAIPEGLGRMEELPSAWAEDGPGILGFGIDWDCNLRCRHCLSSRKGKGVKTEDFQALRTFTEKSRFLRFMGGEFTINKDCLSMLKELGTWEAQPVVFFSLNITVHERPKFSPHLE
jgi:MoaA/NifB/PqqE/SkfB family radical SAM enzyme